METLAGLLDEDWQMARVVAQLTTFVADAGKRRALVFVIVAAAAATSHADVRRMVSPTSGFTAVRPAWFVTWEATL